MRNSCRSSGPVSSVSWSANASYSDQLLGSYGALFLFTTPKTGEADRKVLAAFVSGAREAVGFVGEHVQERGLPRGSPVVVKFDGRVELDAFLLQFKYFAHGVVAAEVNTDGLLECRFAFDPLRGHTHPFQVLQTVSTRTADGQHTGSTRSAHAHPFPVLPTRS